MMRQVQGIIRGTTIELREDPGLADGAEIDVLLLPRYVAHELSSSASGECRTAAGMLAHLPPEVDEELEAIIGERKKGVFREISE